MAAVTLRSDHLPSSTSGLPSTVAVDSHPAESNLFGCMHAVPRSKDLSHPSSQPASLRHSADGTVSGRWSDRSSERRCQPRYVHVLRCRMSSVQVVTCAAADRVRRLGLDSVRASWAAAGESLAKSSDDRTCSVDVDVDCCCTHPLARHLDSCSW